MLLVEAHEESCGWRVGRAELGGRFGREEGDPLEVGAPLEVGLELVEVEVLIVEGLLLKGREDYFVGWLGVVGGERSAALGRSKVLILQTLNRRVGVFNQGSG